MACIWQSFCFYVQQWTKAGIVLSGSTKLIAIAFPLKAGLIQSETEYKFKTFLRTRSNILVTVRYCQVWVGYPPSVIVVSGIALCCSQYMYWIYLGSMLNTFRSPKLQRQSSVCQQVYGLEMGETGNRQKHNQKIYSLEIPCKQTVNKVLSWSNYIFLSLYNSRMSTYVLHIHCLFILFKLSIE